MREVGGVAPEPEIDPQPRRRTERLAGERSAQLARGSACSPLEDGNDVRESAEAIELGVREGDGLLDEEQPLWTREELGLLDVEDGRAAHGDETSPGARDLSQRVGRRAADEPGEKRGALAVGIVDGLDSDTGGAERERGEEAGDPGADD